MCILIFYTTFAWNISHSKKNWARYDKKKFSEILLKMYIGLHVKYRLFLSDFNETWIFWADLWNIFKYQISWKSIQWEPSCSMRTDRRTDMTKLILASRNFVRAPKNGRFEFSTLVTIEIISLCRVYVLKAVNVPTVWKRVVLKNSCTLKTDTFDPFERFAEHLANCTVSCLGGSIFFRWLEVLLNFLFFFF